MGKGKHWTPEEDETLIYLIQHEKTNKEISTILNRPVRGVQFRRNKIGVPVNKKWTPMMDKVLKQMRSEGYSYQEISQVLGKTRQATQHRAWKYGLTNPSGANWILQKAGGLINGK